AGSDAWREGANPCDRSRSEGGTPRADGRAAAQRSRRLALGGPWRAGQHCPARRQRRSHARAEVAAERAARWRTAQRRARRRRLLATHGGYRRFATKEPGFFSLMFGRVVPEFRPSATAGGRAKTFGRVLEAALACLD